MNHTLPQITLRPMEPEDLDMLYSIENDSELWATGLTTVPYSRYLLHDYIARSTGDIYTDKQVRLMIADECRQVVGMVDLTNFDPKHMRAEIGIVVIGDRRRQGYALSAIDQLLRYARQTLHLHQVYAVVDSSNEAAVELFRKLKFESSSTLCEWLYDGSTYRDALLFQCML